MSATEMQRLLEQLEERRRRAENTLAAQVTESEAGDDAYGPPPAPSNEPHPEPAPSRLGMGCDHGRHCSQLCATVAPVAAHQLTPPEAKIPIEPFDGEEDAPDADEYDDR